MGYSSFTCAKTGKPILNNAFSDEYCRKYSRMVLILPDNTKIHGEYNGYGRIYPDDYGEDDIEFWPDMYDDKHDMKPGRPKLVLEHYYAGEDYQKLGESFSDPGQGHFYDDKQLWEIFDNRPHISYQELQDMVYGKS